MIEFSEIGVSYGAQDVLERVSFRVNRGEKVGIIGPNGSGKSTLFRLILGEAGPSRGEIKIEGEPRIGYVRQVLSTGKENESLLEYSLRGISGLSEMERQMHDLHREMSDTVDTDARARLLRKLGVIQTEFEHMGGYDQEARVKASLGGLGFGTEEFEKPFKSFSGGWQMRAELSRVLASNPDLLLLDEPSNYLDLPAVEWLQRFLKGFDGTLMLISHDRYLLRTLARITVEVDAGTATRYNGDLDFYLRDREVRHASLMAAKENQDRRIEQLERFVERFKATSTKAAQAQSRAKMIERIKAEAIQVPRRSMAAGFLRVAPSPHCGVEVARLEDVDFSYDGRRKILDGVNLDITRGDKIAIVGYNGMGKTTLLRILAGTHRPSAGRCIMGHKVVVGYLSQEFSETVDPGMSVLACARLCKPYAQEKELRTQLGSFGFTADDISKPAGVLSGGEKIRLAFFRIFLVPPSLMLLDEPTTHLDMDGRATLEKALELYDGTVCIVSHDVEFVRNIATSIIEITRSGVRRFPGGYDYYMEKTAPEREIRVNTPAAGQAGQAGSVKQHEGMTSKEARKLAARERARLQPVIRKLRSDITGIESRVADLESELEELAGVMFNPVPGTDYAITSKRLKHVQDQISHYTSEWESKSAELEVLEKEQSALPVRQA